MTLNCSECGAVIISKAEELNISATPETLARHLKLMTTNEPPNGPELAYIRAVVSKTGPRLACLDDEISRLEGQLKQLKKDRAVLSEYHAQNTTIISPLRRMPREILGEIFSWTLSSAVFDVRESPWVLTYVCSHWRAVSISKPSLWSLVHINFPQHDAYPLTMIETHIQRAQTLKIRFFGRTKKDSRTQIQMFKLLSDHSDRWEELTLQLTADLVPHLVALAGRLPVLRRLWVQWDGSKSQNGVDSLKCFENAYSLVDVGAYSEYQFIPTVLPPHNLITRYHFDAPWDTHSSMLKLAPNLVEARIRVNFEGAEPWPHSDETIQLLRLRRLYVSNAKIFDYLTTPILEEAAIHHDEEDDDFCTPLVPLLIRSSCPLRRLCLRGSPNPHSTAAILEKISTITELVILITEVASQGDATFRSLLTLLDGSRGTWVSPQLSEICFGFRRKKSIAIDYPFYLRMLQSRWESATCALAGTSLLTAPGSCPDPETLRKLEVLRKDGLDISLLSGPDAVYVMNDWIYSTQ
ncbi:hypothetical protein B0H11DRAFT_2189846 [Mycena galericulata]|nr:hypothetical protein B0H11DRAFT_2189846 [Mycena galericulata]